MTNPVTQDFINSAIEYVTLVGIVFCILLALSTAVQLGQYLRRWHKYKPRPPMATKR